MFDVSLPREDLSRRRSELFRPPRHERANSFAARRRATIRRLADLQFGSIWRDLAALLPKVRGTLVDVGSGAQPFRELLDVSVQYIAVDIVDSEPQFGYRTHGTRYYQGSRLPVADAEAQAVLCTETIEHVLETKPFLDELFRILANDGQLILTVPFAARWHFVPNDFWRFTPSGLLHLLETAGFRDVRIYARGGALAVASYKVLSCVLLLLSGHGSSQIKSLPSRLLGICLLPIALLAAVIGNIALRFPTAIEDTLGYTVLAGKSRIPEVDQSATC